MSFNQMFDFIKTRVLPSKKFLADSKRFNRLYEKLFKRKDSKKRQIFEMPEDSKDREFFSPQDIEQVLEMEVEQGELAEINQPVPIIDTMFSGNLVNYIEGVFSKIKTDFYEKPDSVLKIALGGDKGEKSMKFHFQTCHPETSVFDVHVFCMFEGSDTPENMSKVLEKYSSAFQRMADPNSRIQGHKVEFFWEVISNIWMAF